MPAAGTDAARGRGEIRGTDRGRARFRIVASWVTNGPAADGGVARPHRSRASGRPERGPDQPRHNRHPETLRPNARSTRRAARAAKRIPPEFSRGFRGLKRRGLLGPDTTLAGKADTGSDAAGHRPIEPPRQLPVLKAVPKIASPQQLPAGAEPFTPTSRSSAHRDRVARARRYGSRPSGYPTALARSARIPDPLDLPGRKIPMHARHAAFDGFTM